ncbi:unnamed protein product [Colias eurytheme]|nr:unnamed protein product [Colias eurytheme]
MTEFFGSWSNKDDDGDDVEETVETVETVTTTRTTRRQSHVPSRVIYSLSSIIVEVFILDKWSSLMSWTVSL